MIEVNGEIVDVHSQIKTLLNTTIPTKIVTKSTPQKIKLLGEYNDRLNKLCQEEKELNDIYFEIFDHLR